MEELPLSSVCSEHCVTAAAREDHYVGLTGSQGTADFQVGVWDCNTVDTCSSLFLELRTGTASVSLLLVQLVLVYLEHSCIQQ